MTQTNRPSGGTKSPRGNGSTARKKPATGPERKAAAKAAAGAPNTAPAAKARTKPSRSAPGSRSKVLMASPAPVAREQMIAERAYFLAEQRGFGDGAALDDWLAAEREIDARLSIR